MLKITRRPITDEERAIVESWKAPPGPAWHEVVLTGCVSIPVLFVGLAIGAMVGGIFAMIFLPPEAQAAGIGSGVLIGAGTGVLGGAIYMMLLRMRQLKDERNAAIVVSDVEVLHAVAEDVIFIESDDEDQLPAYAFQVEEDRLMFVSEIDTGELVEERKFPCLEFTIVRTLPANLVVTVTCAGTPIQPSQLYTAHSETEYIPQELRMVKGTLSKLSQVLNREAKRAHS